MSETPRLSVVIACIDPGPIFIECLSALSIQRSADVEVLVVAASSGDTAKQVRLKFPWIRVIDPGEQTSLPRLRGVGIAESRAPVVGIIDPWCLVSSTWVAEAIQIHEEILEPAAGGSVELAQSARESVSEWATYLFDYWEFVPPIESGITPVLAGNNIVYKRAALPGENELRSAGFWKAFTNLRLKSSGLGLWSSERLSVEICRRIPLRSFFRSRYHHGRSYAAMRVESSPWIVRLKWATITPGLPLLLMSRQVRGLAGKPRARKWLVVCAPLLLAFNASWAFGELLGYLAGPGRSHDAIRS